LPAAITPPKAAEPPSRDAAEGPGNMLKVAGAEAEGLKSASAMGSMRAAFVLAVLPLKAARSALLGLKLKPLKAIAFAADESPVRF